MHDDQQPRPLAQRRRRHRRGRRHQASNQDIDVGGMLRALRIERQLSIRALAEQSGLAINTLSLIENGKTSPSVSTLQQLAQTLDVPITAFFEEAPTTEHMILTRANQRVGARFDYGSLFDLGAGLIDCPIKPFLVNLAPGASSGPHTITHSGYEFVVCLAAQITYTVQQQELVLDPGDSLLFAAHLPHRWQNLTTTEAQMLIVFCPMKDQYRPEQLHFDM